MSLKEIAKKAGTSVSTVSRVLNHPEHNCNDPVLAEKIWDIAQSIHYLPNSSARNLRLGITEQAEPFSVDIFLTRFDSLDQDFFFRELYHYVKDELIGQNCHLGRILSPLNILSPEEDKQKMKAVPYKSSSALLSESQNNPSMFTAEKTNTGLIILGKCPGELLPILKKRYAHIIGIDRNPMDYEYDEVVCNGTTAAEIAMEHLISLGHRNIAYIGDCTYESRYIGYYQVLLNHKIPLTHENIYPANHTREEGYRIMQTILQSDRRPTAIFCANDSTALGVLQAIRQNKKRGYFPSVISIDNIKESQHTEPMLTTIDIPKKEMAHLAVMLLNDRKNGSHREHVRIELPCRLIIRESCTYCAK